LLLRPIREVENGSVEQTRFVDLLDSGDADVLEELKGFLDVMLAGSKGEAFCQSCGVFDGRRGA
jgi:hypothetical protein